jgi:acetolactate synthase-1/2/3 large subunit
MTTSGPGATNLTTAIATAHMDSSPIVAITGQVRTSLIGNDAFQEADTTGITRPVTKHNCMIKNVKDVARTVHEAFYIARTGRPGPVLIDMPSDVAMSKYEGRVSKEIDLPGYKPRFEANIRQIRLAADAINQSKRPVLYAGGGVILSGASELLRELAHKGNLPVTNTLMGLGSFSGDDPLFLGMLGMHGTATANYAITESDLVIAVGARFDDRITGRVDEFAPGAKVIHIDIDPASIGKNIKVDVPVVGDAKWILTELNKLITFSDRTDWLNRINEWRRKHPLTYTKEEGVVKPQYVVQQLCEAATPDAIVTTEVGQHQMWTAQWYTFRHPRTLITSGGLGTMGFGLPAAIGAQAAFPNRLVIDISGHRRREQAAGESRHLQQRLPRHGAPVAGVVLQAPLQSDAADRQSGLREGGGGLRRDGHAHREAGGGAPDHREGVRHAGSGRDGLHRVA